MDRGKLAQLRYILLMCSLGVSACDSGGSPTSDLGLADGDMADAGPCADGSARTLMLRDADEDGFGTLAGADAHGCPAVGWVPYPADGRLDCDDGDARATPDAEDYCDFDSDGAIGLDDCDDHNHRRHPGAVERCNDVDDDCDGLVDDEDQDGLMDPEDTWARDEDDDGYASEVFLACEDPGDGFVLWGERTKELDCAPLDPDVHPHRMDDCAARADANCDGVFEPVYVEEPWFPQVPYSSAGFTAAGEDDPPTLIAIPGNDPITIDLCPGTYRVMLDLGTSFAWRTDFTVRGHGASPEEVVLDAAHAGRTVVVPPWANLDQIGRASVARFENLTLTGGRAPDGERGGCILQGGNDDPHSSGALTLDRVLLRDCRADVGGAVAVERNNMLTMTDVVITDAHATQRGGGVDFEGLSLTMSGGSFSDVSAPGGQGAALAARLPVEQSLSLQSVDLGAVTNDFALRTEAETVVRDLADGASLTCTPTACTP